MTLLEDAATDGAGEVGGGGAVAAGADEGGGVVDQPPRVRPRPQVPPKPPIDTLRYSMNNIKESVDWQLDALLEELSALETQLNSSSGGDQLLLGIPSLPSSSSTTHSERKPCVEQSQITRVTDSKDDVRAALPACATSLCSSPDGDSAFGDASSTESARCRNSAFSSNDSCRESLHTPSPTQISPRSTEATAEDPKIVKIKQALEKMREAKVTRIFINFSSRMVHRCKCLSMNDGQWQILCNNWLTNIILPSAKIIVSSRSSGSIHTQNLRGP
ncbi:hypothetical protein KIN20_031804 [Parelaphostrongylus tenuis]|uniref:Uncharacterized protein n=1 Tax=Parelaphostrongylus tenuis TaxID=148309 RepID=A0AAD5R611_PARTN|nr:hypothetical protein KIN20_031804 [Parelaphostrongylus tenuis]